jgi:hypothetical protein
MASILRTLGTCCSLLLASAALVGCDGTVNEEGEGPSIREPAAYGNLPDVSAAGVNCSTLKFKNTQKAREIYDTFFARGLPAGDAGFEWHVDSSIVTPELVEKVYFPPLNTSGLDGHQYLSFNNCVYERGAAANADIFSQLDTRTQAPFRRYNPRDFTPAAATYYARSEWNDVIANQFVYRVACDPAGIAQALELCPDCDDVVVPLSKYDLYRIFEVRFARASGNQILVSRVFKFIGIDASGAIGTHAASPAMRFASVNGEVLWAKWRAEISGRLYAMLGSGGPVGMMIRSSSVNDYGCGAGSAPPKPQPAPQCPAACPNSCDAAGKCPAAPAPQCPAACPNSCDAAGKCPAAPAPTTCQYAPATALGDNGESCAGVPVQTWRCVQSKTQFPGSYVSQVCRCSDFSTNPACTGSPRVWLTYHTSLDAGTCASCCGTYAASCS